MSLKDFNNRIKRISKQGKKKKTQKNNSAQDKIIEELKNLIAFENSMASKATHEGIERASSLFQKFRKKFFGTKITQIFFN